MDNPVYYWIVRGCLIAPTVLLLVMRMLRIYRAARKRPVTDATQRFEKGLQIAAIAIVAIAIVMLIMG